MVRFPNLSFPVIASVLVALEMLLLFGILDLWTKRRFASVNARIRWTAVLLISGPLALVASTIVVTRRKPVAIPAT